MSTNRLAHALEHEVGSPPFCFYVIQVRDAVKIGITGNFNSRMAQYRSHAPFKITIRHCVKTAEQTARQAERALVEQLSPSAYRRSRIGRQEWFVATHSVLSKIDRAVSLIEKGVILEPPQTTRKAKSAEPKVYPKKKLEIVMRQNVGFTQEDLDALDRLETTLAQEHGIRRMGTARAVRFALRAALDSQADPKALAESIKKADGRTNTEEQRYDLS